MPWRPGATLQTPPHEMQRLDAPPLRRLASKTYLQQTPRRLYEVASRSVETNDRGKETCDAVAGRKKCNAD